MSDRSKNFGRELKRALVAARASDDRIVISNVWLVYARTDVAVAQALVETLGARSIDMMWDRRLAPGEPYDEAIEQGIRDSIAVVGLFSEAAIGSQFMRDEATLALECKKLVPVHVPDFDVQRLPMRFRRLQVIPVTDLDALVEVLRARQAQAR